MIRNIKKLSQSLSLKPCPLAVYALALCLGPGQAWAELDHAPGGYGADPSRPQTAGRQGGFRGCRVPPALLNDFANGYRPNFVGMSVFLGAEACQEVGPQLSAEAISQGVNWNRTAPYRMDIYSKTAASVEQSESGGFKEKFAQWLRRDPKGSKELIPLIGQAALISQDAGREGWIGLAKKQLITADGLLNQPGANKAEIGQKTAAAMMKLGLDQPLLAKALGENVEEMAAYAQASNLGKILRALGVAAHFDTRLEPTFQQTSDGLGTGIARAGNLFTDGENGAMWKIVMDGIRAVSEYRGGLTASMPAFDTAVKGLLGDKGLDKKVFRKSWKEILKLLNEFPELQALGKAVALSLTPQVIFLSEDDRVELVLASRYHPTIALALQSNVLTAYEKMMRNSKRGILSASRFKKIRDKFLKPWVASLMELNAFQITRPFLSRALRKRWVSDATMEKRFPILVLDWVNHGRKSGEAGEMEGAVDVSARQFAALWNLSRGYLPALWRWAERYERRQKRAQAESSTNSELAQR